MANDTKNGDESVPVQSKGEGERKRRLVAHQARQANGRGARVMERANDRSSCLPAAPGPGSLSPLPLASQAPERPLTPPPVRRPLKLASTIDLRPAQGLLRDPGGLCPGAR